MKILGAIQKHSPTDEDETSLYTVLSTPLGMRYDVYISEEIGMPNKYSGLVSLIRGMTSSDCCNIFLNTPGGVVSTGVQIIAAIGETDGFVRTIVEGDANSMGALIFMAGHELSISRHSSVLFHNASCGYGGKAHEVLSHAAATTALFSGMMRDMVVPFLSNEEVDKILSGNEFYLNTKGTLDRFSRIGEVQNDGSVIKFETLEKWNPGYTRPMIGGVAKQKRPRKRYIKLDKSENV